MAEANAALPEARRIVLRIGINLGDVIVEGSDLYGDGVNIAARLEAWPSPAASGFAQRPRTGQAASSTFGFDDLGRQTLKNIAEPVRVYRVRDGPRSGVAATRAPCRCRPSPRSPCCRSPT